ncbi:MAG TPA: hypothetical protein VFQ42_04165 [Mycobacterium sp.]|nr:hypothetical protein [Mycobacterium sp.]
MTGQQDEPPGRLAEVRHLPVRHSDDEVVDAEIVDEPYLSPAGQAAAAARRRAGYVQDAKAVVVTVRTVATHRRTRTVLRHALYVALGLKVLLTRLWQARSMTRYDRLADALATAGHHDQILEVLTARDAAVDRRHKRRMDWLAAPGRILRATLITLVVIVAILLVIGLLMFIGSGHGRDVIVPIKATATAVAWIVGVIAFLWVVLLAAAGVLVTLMLWQIGRNAAAPAPYAAAPVDEGGTDPRAILPTTGAILDALRHLRIPALNDAFKQGWASPGWPVRVWVTDPYRDGKGWRAQLALPHGVPVELIARRDKRAVLAHNLARKPVEVWPTEPADQPAVLDLWVADQGSLTGPVPPWPLLAALETAQVDYFKGVPVGFGIRGDVVSARLFECNYVVGGIMGSGKSTLVIDMILGGILDPLVDVDVRVLAENADYEPMRRRLRSLVTGAGSDVVQSCLDLLAEAYEDVQRRGKALREHDERANSRKLAEKDSRLRPRILVVDECQALFMDGKLGEQAADLAIKLQSAARKYAITLIWLTPEPTKDSLPRKLVATASHKACFAIGDQTSNDAVLGTGSYKQGVSAVGLEPKTDESLGDVGTAMTRGFFPKPALLRCCYVPQGDAHRVTDRALQLVAGARPAIEAGEEAEVRDLLDDVVMAMAGADRVRSEWLRGQLADRWPDSYGGWSAQDFATALRAAGVEIQKRRLDGKGGQQVVLLDEVLDAADGRAGESEVEHEDP